jgi:hypothetical protein
MAFLPQLFLSNINAKDGLARPSRFQVVLPIPRYISEFVSTSVIERLLNLPNSVFSDITARVIGTEDGARSFDPVISRYLALQCESTELPGKSLQTDEVQIYGPTFQVPRQAVYGDISFTFLCTNDFYERKLFDRWLEAIVPTDTNNTRFAKGERTRFLTDIKIVQYDDVFKQVYAVELIDAFPKAISPQTLSWSEEGFHRLNVQFAYQKFRTIYKGDYDVGAIGAALVGAGIAGTPTGRALKTLLKGTIAEVKQIF